MFKEKVANFMNSKQFSMQGKKEI